MVPLSLLQCYHHKWYMDAFEKANVGYVDENVDENVGGSRGGAVYVFEARLHEPKPLPSCCT